MPTATWSRRTTRTDQSTKASYTDAGRLATLTDTTGAVTTYHYNDDGNCGRRH